MVKKTFAIAGLLILGASMVFAAGRAEPVPEGVQRVRFAADGFLLGSQSWIAHDRGYFTEENIEAQISLYGTGIEAIQAVIAQQADLGPGLEFAVLNLAAAADQGMQVVASIAAPLPGFHSLAVRSDIRRPQDLRGKKIGFVEGTAQHYVTMRHLEMNGVGLNEVELIRFPGLFEIVGALRTNNIQAGWVWLTGTTEAQNDPNIEILGTDADVLDSGSVYLIARSEWAAQNQELIVRVLRAYHKASEYINSETPAAAQIIATAVSGNAEQFARTIPNQRYRVRFTQTQMDSFDRLSRFLIDSGRLRPDFDIRDFINFEAMEIAVPGSVEVDL